tara:strand:+ start:486 stop:3338 length:2853 start_codon:yes stop_codon:yes gene_type:complete
MTLSAAPSIAQAQTAPSPQAEGRVTGRVVTPSGAFLTGAEVRVEGSDIVSVTDSDGRFSLPRVAAGPQQLVVTYFGYDTARTSLTISPATAQDVEIRMNPAVAAANGDIVVNGSRPIAESEEAAIQYKRASTSLVDVIAADGIGRFPDQNMAAAISRLPGVSVGRDQGQERYISLRGSPSYWTTLAFDGVNVVSPAGRDARFDTIPSAIASKVVIRKAVTPDMPGETVAGNIDVVTRSPFDYPGLKVSGDAAVGYMGLGGGKQYDFSGFVSDTFADGTFGVLLSASRYEREMVTDNYETDWSSEEDAATGQDGVWASETQNKLYRLTRSNTSFSGRLEWRPDNDNKVFLSSIWTQFRDDELRNAYVFGVEDAVGYADSSYGNTGTTGTLYNVPIESTLNSGSSRQSIFTTTLGGDHDLGAWRINWRANFTRADDESKDPFQSSWVDTNSPSMTYDLTNTKFAKVNFYSTVENADGSYALGGATPYISPTDLEMDEVSRDYSLARTDAYTAKFNIEHDLSLFGADTVFKFGAEYDNRTKKVQETSYVISADDLTEAGLTVPTAAAVSIDTPYKGKMPMTYGFKYFSSDAGSALISDWEAAGIGGYDEDTPLENNYRVTEEIVAGYAMGTTYFDWGNIVYGARMEHIRNTGSALSEIDGGWVPTKVSSTDFRVYPSLHFNWDVTKNLKARLSFNTGAARPDYDLLRPNFTYDDDEQIVSGGNPEAKPETAKGLDAYFEWYMPSRGFLSVGAYYKKLDNILYDVSLNDFGSDLLNSGGVDRSTYSYETTTNGGSGHIKGVEFALVQPLEDILAKAGAPDWALGFGLRGTLTVNDSKATTPDGRTTDLPGSSPLIYNLSAYYERYGFSARVSYQWQDAYLDSINDDLLVGDTYWAAVSRLDVSLRYSVSKNLQLYFDANNLTNEPGIRYQGVESRVIEHEMTGRRYMGGVRFNF